MLSDRTVLAQRARRVLPSGAPGPLPWQGPMCGMWGSILWKSGPGRGARFRLRHTAPPHRWSGPGFGGRPTGGHEPAQAQGSGTRSGAPSGIGSGRAHSSRVQTPHFTDAEAGPEGQGLSVRPGRQQPSGWWARLPHCSPLILVV